MRTEISYDLRQLYTKFQDIIEENRFWPLIKAGKWLVPVVFTIEEIMGGTPSGKPQVTRRRQVTQSGRSIRSCEDGLHD